MFCLSVLGSDLVYSEGAVVDLLDTLVQLCGAQTTIFLAGELRNGECLSLPCPCMLAHPTHTPHTRRHMQVLKFLLLIPVADAVLEYFLDAAMKEFVVGRVEQTRWHPEYCSPRVAMYVLVKK